MLGALIGALGALGSGALTANSIDNQNEMARQQFQQNYAFQKYQYEDMKRYQSPANQVRLLKEAGLNPALALDSKLTGTALSSVGGISPTASAVSQDYSSIPSAASNLMQGFANTSLTESQVKNVDADTENKNLRNQNQLRMDLANIEKLLSDKRLNDTSRKQLQLQANYLSKQLRYADERLEWENQEQRFKVAGVALDNALKEIELLFAPMLNKAQINSLGALAFMNYKQGKLAGKSIDKIEAETMYEWNELFKNLPEGEQGFSEWQAMKNNKGFKVTRYALGLVFKALGSIPKP